MGLRDLCTEIGKTEKHNNDETSHYTRYTHIILDTPSGGGAHQTDGLGQNQLRIFI